MRQNTGTARGARVAVRLNREDRVRIDEVMKTRGYTSLSAFIRAAVENELNGRPALTKTEDLITGGFEGMSRDNIRIVRSQQALHALLDTFVKTVLTCLPEPSIRRPAPSRRPSQGPVPATDQGCRSKHVRRCPRRA